MVFPEAEGELGLGLGFSEAVMEEENSSFGMEGNTESLEQSNGFVDEFADDHLFEGGDLSIDLDMLFDIIDEERDKKDSDPSQVGFFGANFLGKCLNLFEFHFL